MAPTHGSKKTPSGSHISAATRVGGSRSAQATRGQGSHRSHSTSGSQHAQGPRQHLQTSSQNGSSASSGPHLRPQLTDAQIQMLGERMRDKYGWQEDPHFFQLDDTRWQIERVNRIIQASTGQGKTAVVAGPYAWQDILGARDVTIMVVPLLALQPEMVRHTITFSCNCCEVQAHCWLGENI
ncbi:uncharacterized protein PHACADRAFT_99149 [Phanerochaete carnosa HHB-10118-sp]|uniref:DEAD/DEAH box helicase domain-containing protein n=1 Tax=Phanerochaete carnosa (strain HHB-10118-sp) TaxID=650164 RepID=K5WTE0_PHACS|nr:uncharacterized protein PHACADRAFT_99149 [Phanerochaete carnosa HHB-10118-sp]EKM53697.1 hypothetical protein PHACADRAFT_99149 [Phanerochaete carnosa HHB-10118-sp]